jgi:hypothetical protein
MHETNQLCIVNFFLMCSKLFVEERYDALLVYQNSLRHLLDHPFPLTPSKPLLTLTVFDGINTRSQVLKLLQSKNDLDEVTLFESTHADHRALTLAYLDHARHAIGILDDAEHDQLLAWLNDRLKSI